MRVLIVTPARRGDRGGNRVTALRWAALIRSAGHRVRITEAYRGEPCDVMVALHATKSHRSIVELRERMPSARLIVALTGTDVYGAIDEKTRRSLELADRIVVLQPRAVERLEREQRAKARAIFQSATPIVRRATEEPVYTVVSHLRRIKDPLRAARAARLLPADSRVRVLHAGAALDEEYREQAEREMRESPRYRWLGSVSRKTVRKLLCESRALIISSYSEGGANVVCEAIAAGVPVLASRIDGTIGQLGEDYPGYFEVEDTGGLADLMLRLERDASFAERLTEHCSRLAPLFAPDRERALWANLLAELEPAPAKSARFRVVDLGSPPSSFRDDVASGFEAKRKFLSCRYFYDDEGSRIFQAICELEEYYVPRAEREILEARRSEIVSLAPVDAAVVELGSGDSAKTRVILEAFQRRFGRVRYLPVDIAAGMLADSAAALLRDFGGLEVKGIAGEYGPALQHLQQTAKALPKLILFLGSNIGNFDRPDAARFLASVRETMSGGDLLLVGIDLRKSKAILEPAYDDPAGVTAEFNLNLLARINKELGGRFDLAAFAHRAEYQETEGRIAMYLESLREQTVRIAAIGADVRFAAGERIHTEYSYKYSAEEIDELARQAGLVVRRRWTDSKGLFSTNLLALQ